MLNINETDARKDLDQFYGKGAGKSPSNFFYRDYIYASFLKKKYGMEVDKLAKKLGYDTNEDKE